MSAPAPANRRSASGSRRFNPLKALQPKRRLQQMLSSSPIPVPKPIAATATAGAAAAAAAPVTVPVLAPPAFDYCRFIELDYVPMETGYMVSMRPTKGYATPTKGFDTPTKGYTTPTKGFDTPTKGYATPTKGFDTHSKTLPTRSPERHGRTGHSPSNPRSRRISAPPSGRDPYGNTSLSNSSNSGSCKGSDCSPTKGRHQKYTSCTDNHGIRPPPPEQYLTPLQQKEVCIRHLRARLKETVDRLQDRDSEIGELRGQLCRMQDDWVEEECHRVEAQLALKEARHEIHQLKDAVDTVRTSLGQVTGSSPTDRGGGGGSSEIQKYFQDINTQNHKLENLLLSMEQAQAAVARDGGEFLGGRRVRAGGSAPASVSGESPGGIPRSLISGIGGGGGRGGAGGSCSCDCSPAHSLTRSSTYTKLSEQALLGDGRAGDFPGLSGGTGPRDSGFVCCGEAGGAVPSQADLLLEAAFLSEETASLLSSYSTHSLPHTLPRSLPHTLPHPHTSPTHRAVPHSSTCDTLCGGGGVGGGGGGGAAPMAVHCCSLGGMGSLSHPCLSHHLYLHHLREQGIQTESCPAAPLTGAGSSDLDTIAEQRTFRSQACSPTSTWMSDEGEDAELDDSTASVATATLMSMATEPLPARSPGLAASSPFPRSATVSCALDGPLCPESDGEEGEEKKDQGMEKEREEVEGSEGEEWRQQGLVSTAGGQGVEEEAAPGKQQDLGQASAGRQGEPVGCSAGERVGEEEMDGAGERVAEVGMEGAGFGERQGETVECGAGERVREVGMDGAGTAERKRRELEPLSSSNHVPSAEACPASPVQPLCPDSQPLTSQPKRSLSQDQTAGVTVVQVNHEEDDDEEDEVEGAIGGSTTLAGGAGGGGGDVDSEDGSQSGPVQKSYWSRHFLVDLLAVAVPVVPTVAWLCRGPRHGGQPMYHFGSLLRGCCTVALHSLRRGGGLRHYPAGGGDFGGTQI